MCPGGFRNTTGVHQELDSVEIKSAMANNSASLYTLGGLRHEKLDLNAGVHLQICDGEKRHANVADVDPQSVDRAILTENSDGSVQQLTLAAASVGADVFEEHSKKELNTR